MTISQFVILRDIFQRNPYFSRIPIPVSLSEIFGKDYGQMEEIKRYGHIKTTVESWADRESRINPEQPIPEVTVTRKIHPDDFEKLRTAWEETSNRLFNKTYKIPTEIL